MSNTESLAVTQPGWVICVLAELMQEQTLGTVQGLI